MHRIVILGGDGYLGWPTAMYLSKRGHDVLIVDNMIKKYWESQIGVSPLFNVESIQSRVNTWKEITGKIIEYQIFDISNNHKQLYSAIKNFQPDTVIHYAEQPSAPFSMMSRDACYETQRNNVMGTLNLMFAIQSVNPDIHIIKLGTLGEYGTPNIDIEEGWIEIEHKGRKDKMLYPKKPGSFYHLSKVHDSANLEFTCRIWGQRVTDLNQGVVYGVKTDETNLHENFNTSFHYDSCFGTVINRFITQVVANEDITIYGNGTQTRGYLNILDTLRCVEISLEEPAKKGEFRVFNQFTEFFSVNDIANKVFEAAKLSGLNPKIKNLSNPRIEQENHYYNPKNSALIQLGLKPNYLTTSVLQQMIELVKKYKKNINIDCLLPSILWKS